jgi:hypothetical protein
MNRIAVGTIDVTGDNRMRRDSLSRSGPLRKFGGMLDRAGSSAVSDGTPANLNYVSEGVQTAYKVIDTYLKQGQQAARQMNKMYAAPMQLSGNLVETQNRWMGMYGDLMKNWVEFASLYGDSMASMAAVSGDSYGGSSPGRGESIPVAYEISSKRPVRVSLQFHPGRETPFLMSPGLLSQSDSKPIKVKCQFAGSGVPLILKIKVSKKRKSGSYSGLLLDTRTGDVAGSLTLELS